MEEDGLDDAFEDGPNEWVSFDAGEDVVDVVDDDESAPMPPRADAKAVSATRAVVDDDDASSSPSETARLRRRLEEAEANALRAMSALDAERGERERERARTRALLRAGGAFASGNDGKDVDDAMTSEDGAGWGTRMVSAYARAPPAPRRETLERFVRRAREGGARDGGMKMSLADAKALMDDFEVMDAAIAAAKEESVTREAALAAALAEAEAGARRARDHDEAHALLTAEMSDLKEDLKKSKTESNGLAEEIAALNAALESAKTEARDWKSAADALKRARGANAGVDRGAGDKMLILELECALEALTTTRAELEDVSARLTETSTRAERAEKREAVAAAALEASEWRTRNSPRGRPVDTSASRELRERMERAEIRVEQLTERLEGIDGEHDAELSSLKREHERLCLNLKMMHLTHDDATEMMRLEIADAKRDAAESAGAERDAYWRRVLHEERECHANQLESVRRDVEEELLTKNSKLQRLKHDLVQILKDTA